MCHQQFYMDYNECDVVLALFLVRVVLFFFFALSPMYSLFTPVKSFILTVIIICFWYSFCSVGHRFVYHYLGYFWNVRLHWLHFSNRHFHLNNLIFWLKSIWNISRKCELILFTSGPSHGRDRFRKSKDTRCSCLLFLPLGQTCWCSFFNRFEPCDGPGWLRKCVNKIDKRHASEYSTWYCTIIQLQLKRYTVFILTYGNKKKETKKKFISHLKYDVTKCSVTMFFFNVRLGFGEKQTLGELREREKKKSGRAFK